MSCDGSLPPNRSALPSALQMAPAASLQRELRSACPCPSRQAQRLCASARAKARFQFSGHESPSTRNLPKGLLQESTTTSVLDGYCTCHRQRSPLSILLPRGGSCHAADQGATSINNATSRRSYVFLVAPEPATHPQAAGASSSVLFPEHHHATQHPETWRVHTCFPDPRTKLGDRFIRYLSRQDSRVSVRAPAPDTSSHNNARFNPTLDSTLHNITYTGSTMKPDNRRQKVTS